jgi:ubiquinone/menaquinone biosynthesis C-methylase UbiE
MENPCILEIYCGHDQSVSHQNLFSVDINSDVIRMAKMKSILDNNDTTFIKVNRLSCLPFRDNYFDIVYCKNPEEMITNDIIKEIYRVLKFGGKFIFYQYMIPWIDWDYKDLLRYNGCMISGQKYVNIIRSEGFGVSVRSVCDDAESYIKDKYNKAIIMDNLDDKLFNIMEYLEKGKKFGIWILGRKHMI